MRIGNQSALPLDEWHEDDGPVLWWTFPITEPPYVGTPNDTGYPVEMRSSCGAMAKMFVGGWPGYHTHWTTFEIPQQTATSKL